jgi:predicted HTH domain antitoxin
MTIKPVLTVFKNQIEKIENKIVSLIKAAQIIKLKKSSCKA